jgi:hypothetical protein
MKFAEIEEISTESALAEMGSNPVPQAAFLSLLFSVICKAWVDRLAFLLFSLAVATFIRFRVAQSNSVSRDRNVWNKPASPVTVAFIRLARSKKLHYAGPVAGGGFPPHPLSVVQVGIQIHVNEG